MRRYTRSWIKGRVHDTRERGREAMKREDCDMWTNKYAALLDKRTRFTGGPGQYENCKHNRNR